MMNGLKAVPIVQKSFCGFTEMDHLLRTSNTVNIFSNFKSGKNIKPSVFHISCMDYKLWSKNK